MNHAFRRASFIIIAVLAFVFVSVTGCIGASKERPQTTESSSDIAPVTSIIQEAVSKNRLRGAAIMLVKNNQVIYKKAFGDYTVDTVVPIASSSKWISASVIMSVVEDGQLYLDDPISKYLPNFTEEKGKITLRQLLSHTSGLPGNHRCLASDSMTLAECVEAISKINLQSEPGAEFRYGGVSFQVAGRLAEVASGKSWNTLFEEKIKNPLNMINTSYGQTQNPRIAGGASSSVQDYTNLLQMHLNNGVFNGKKVLSAATVEEMQSDQTRGARIAFTPQPDNRRYGLGEWRDFVSSNGRATQLSGQGAFGFSPWIDRERNLIGVFSVRDRLRNVAPIVQDMQQVIREKVK
ncbi:MAG: serine hydrolase domain-containing protein [Potamolinea sp.]